MSWVRSPYGRAAGSPTRGFIDEWVPTLPTDPQGIPGPTTVPGTWLYKPALIPPGTKGVPGGGQRDQLGNLRVDNPNQPNVGFGSEPFFDIGAFEFIQTFPPHVTAVAALVTDPTARAARAIVPDYQLSLAIGREGQNARLAARLTGWRIDIRPDTQAE